MASLSAVHVSAVAVLAVLRSRSALGSPHGSLPPPIYATAAGGASNVTTTDRDVRTDNARHSYDGLPKVGTY